MERRCDCTCIRTRVGGSSATGSESTMLSGDVKVGEVEKQKHRPSEGDRAEICMHVTLSPRFSPVVSSRIYFRTCNRMVIHYR